MAAALSPRGGGEARTSPNICGAPGIYHLLDCRASTEPFAVRALHELVHYWLRAALELCAARPSDTEAGGNEDSASLLTAVTVVRRRSVQEVLPWGSHHRSSVQRALEQMQSVWVSKGDVESVEWGSGAQILDDDPMQVALRTAERALQVGPQQQLHASKPRLLEIWTLPLLAMTAAASCCVRSCNIRCLEPALREGLNAVKRTLDSLRVRTTVVTLRGASRESLACSVQEDQQDESSPQKSNRVVPPDVSTLEGSDDGTCEVSNVEATRAGVLRYMRRHVTVSFNAQLRLPRGSLKEKLESRPRVLQRVGPEPGDPAVPVACVCPIVLPPAWHGWVNAGSGLVEFDFCGLVRADSIDHGHLFGLPIVARIVDKASRLAARIAPTGSMGCLEAFVAELVAGDCCAIFASRLCPFTLGSCAERRLFLATPATSRPTLDASADVLGQLVLQGAAYEEVASAWAPRAAIHTNSKPHALGSSLSDAANALALDAWPAQRCFNPLLHRLDEQMFCETYAGFQEHPQSFSVNAEAGVRGGGRGAGPASGASVGGGRGRPRAKASKSHTLTIDDSNLKGGRGPGRPRGARAKTAQFSQGSYVPEQPWELPTDSSAIAQRPGLIAIAPNSGQEAPWRQQLSVTQGPVSTAAMFPSAAGPTSMPVVGGHLETLLPPPAKRRATLQESGLTGSAAESSAAHGIQFGSGIGFGSDVSGRGADSATTPATTGPAQRVQPSYGTAGARPSALRRPSAPGVPSVPRSRPMALQPGHGVGNGLAVSALEAASDSSCRSRVDAFHSGTSCLGGQASAAPASAWLTGEDVAKIADGSFEFNF